MAIGKGATGIYFPKEISHDHRDWCKRLFEPTGELIEVGSEDALNAVTALSGSGPAFFYLLMEKLIEDRINRNEDPRAARQEVAIHIRSYCEHQKKNAPPPQPSEVLLEAPVNASGDERKLIGDFISAMISAGKALTLTDSNANDLVLQTGIGAAGMALVDTSLTIEQLRDNVTSKGGTTAAGLSKLNKSKLADTIAEAVGEAHKRAVQLAEGN